MSFPTVTETTPRRAVTPDSFIEPDRGQAEAAAR